MNIRNIILNIFAAVFIVTLFLFAFTWIIFDFEGSSDSLKDTWSIVSSLFGGAATLAAAYIATKLYTDWKVVQTAISQQDLASAISLKLSGMASCLDKYHNFIYEYGGRAFDPDFITDATQNYKEFIEEYSTLEYEFHKNLSNFEEIFLDHKHILTNEESTRFKYYYYDLTHALSIISNKKHFKNFEVKIHQLKQSKENFMKLKSKITDVLILCINLKKY